MSDDVVPFITAYPNTEWFEGETARCDACKLFVSVWDMYTNQKDTEVCQTCVYHGRHKRLRKYDV